MNQSRIQSLIESCTDIAVGFVISVMLGLVVYPLYGAPFTFGDNLEITCIYTVAGLGRRYCTRRWFCNLGVIKQWIGAKVARIVRTAENFRAWYLHYRSGHVLVQHLGRWESFCRALEWTFRWRK
jgi:hypothetical protein